MILKLRATLLKENFVTCYYSKGFVTVAFFKKKKIIVNYKTMGRNYYYKEEQWKRKRITRKENNKNGNNKDPTFENKITFYPLPQGH